MSHSERLGRRPRIHHLEIGDLVLHLNRLGLVIHVDDCYRTPIITIMQACGKRLNITLTDYARSQIDLVGGNPQRGRVSERGTQRGRPS